MTDSTSHTDPSQYRAPADLLQDRIIAITGAGDGIGRCAAKTFAAHGATVILIGRTVPKLEMVYDEIEQAGHPQPAIFPLNLEGATETDYNDMADAIDSTFGRLDGLVHNAAELGQHTPMSNVTSDTWLRVMQVNVNAPFMMTKALLPLLEKSSASAIIFTGSSVGLKGRPFWGPYAVSKAANENMMQILAAELDETTPIRVNSINPGATRTKMRAAAYPAENPASVTPAENIMPLYLYLMGKDSQTLSGQQFDAQPKA